MVCADKYAPMLAICRIHTYVHSSGTLTQAATQQRSDNTLSQRDMGAQSVALVYSHPWHVAIDSIGQTV